MIIVRITSGLGNQMYQYNLYRLLKEKYKDTEVLCDVTWFYSNNDHHGYELERVFNKNVVSDFAIDKASTKDIYKVTGQIPAIIKGPLAKKVVFLMGPVNRILRERRSYNKLSNYLCEHGENPITGVIEEADNDRIQDKANNIIKTPEEVFYDKLMNLDINKDYYIIGFCIEEKYVMGRISSLKRELRFEIPSDEKNLRMLEDIDSCNAVSIHVRRGDYLSSQYSGMFVSLGEDYYKRAVQEIQKRIDNPKFFIFSDDSDFVKANFDWITNKVCVSHNTGDDSYKDMFLMTRCKANIIANSTFSQWGSLLNVNSFHFTVYPKDYLFGKENEIKKMDGWIRV